MGYANKITTHFCEAQAASPLIQRSKSDVKGGQTQKPSKIRLFYPFSKESSTFFPKVFAMGAIGLLTWPKNQKVISGKDRGKSLLVYTTNNLHITLWCEVIWVSSEEFRAKFACLFKFFLDTEDLKYAILFNMIIAWHYLPLHESEKSLDKAYCPRNSIKVFCSKKSSLLMPDCKVKSALQKLKKILLRGGKHGN